MADGNSKGWTFDTFETWVTSTNDERAKAVDAALTAANEKAKAHNDILGAMKDQSATYVTKTEAALQFKGLAIGLGSLAAFAAIVGAVVTFGGG